MNFISNILHVRPSTKIGFAIGFSLLLKLIWVIILTIGFTQLEMHDLINGWIVKHVDYGYFLKPVDNYFDYGLYSYDLKEPFAGRMPGYWLPYMILRFIVDQNVALTTLIVFQIVFAAISSVLAAEIVRLLTDSTRYYYVIIVVFALNPFFAVFDTQTIGESFSVSSFITFLYFLILAYKRKNNVELYYFLAGLFLTWSIFLRAYLGVCLLVILPIFNYLIQKKNFRKSFFCCFLFLSSFFIFESAWTYRNYKTLNEFIPLTTGVDQYGRIYSEGWNETRRLIYLWGEQAAYFEPGVAHWFHQEGELPPSVELENFVVQGSYSVEDIKALRRMHLQSLKTFDSSQFANLDSKVAVNAIQMQNSFKHHYPFRAYVISPVQGLIRLVFSSGSSYFPMIDFKNLHLGLKAMKLIFAVAYYFSLALGIIGLFLIIRSEFLMGLSLMVIILSIIAAIIFYSVIQEARYFIHVFPLLVMLSFYTLISLNYLKSSRTHSKKKLGW